jgi:hypothetical protein
VGLITYQKLWEVLMIRALIVTVAMVGSVSAFAGQQQQQQQRRQAPVAQQQQAAAAYNNTPVIFRRFGLDQLALAESSVDAGGCGSAGNVQGVISHGWTLVGYTCFSDPSTQNTSN